MKAKLIAITILVACYSISANSAIFKCVDENSKTSFQSKPCANSQTEMVVSVKNTQSGKSLHSTTQCQTAYNYCYLRQRFDEPGYNAGVARCMKARKVCNDGSSSGVFEHPKSNTDLIREYEASDQKVIDRSRRQQDYVDRQWKKRQAKCASYRKQLKRLRSQLEKNMHGYAYREVRQRLRASIKQTEINMSGC